MPVVRTIVLLFAFPAGQSLNLRGDALWYRNYFFGPSYGQSGYWMKQTSYQLILDGDVRDWVSVDDPNPNLTDRTSVINMAIRAMEQNHGVDFNSYDVVILVIGAPSNVSSDGGSTQASSEDRKHAGLVIRTGDRFDFVAHELGHALGLNHSYGYTSYKNSSWSQPGEYGHPYCVMSAMGYGGIGGPYFPPSPRDGRPEYSGLGPSLNAGTALERGWLDAQVHQLPGAQTDYDLRSRHWLGKVAGSTSQALEVRAVDGKTYVIEYRKNVDWDAGQDSPALIINAMRGSSADLAHPNTQSATYLGMIRLPITFGAHNSIYNGPGFGIEILDQFTWSNTLRFRLRPGRVEPTPLKLTVRKDRLSEEVIETGMTTFERGVKLCVEGTWMYEKVKREEVATFDATYPLVTSPFSVTWYVEGTALSDASGSLSLPGKTVKTANPMLTEQKNNLWVIVKYEILTLPNGSRLRLFNQPDDQTYDLAIAATLTSSVGNGSDDAHVKFEGMVYRYPPEFYERWSDCIRNLIDIGRRYVRYKVLLEPDLWKRIPDRFVDRVQESLTLLGQLHEQGEERAFRDVLNDLEALVGVASLAPLIVSHEDRVELPPVVVVQELGSGDELPGSRPRGLGGLFAWLRKLLVGTSNK